jgi:flagellar motor switch protein FliM
MNDALSQEDIDRMLKATSDKNSTPAISDKELQKSYNRATSRRIKVYDFKRPDKFSKDQIRTIQMMHETFARLTTTSLSAQLRLLVNVHIIAVEQLTYEEFIRSISNPSTLAVVNMEPLKGSAIYEIDPAVTFVIIDRMFGGAGGFSRIYRELTDIESTAMETIIVRILNNLRESWSNVIDLRPRLGNIETNPQFAQIVPPNDMVVLITFEIKVGDYEGAMNLCIPYLTIEPIINKLSAQYWYSSVRKGISEKNYKLLNENLSNVELKIYAELGTTTISVEDAMNLEIGDVLRLPNYKINEEIVLKIGKKTKFKAMPGAVGKRMAVEVAEITEKIESVSEFLDGEGI